MCRKALLALVLTCVALFQGTCYGQLAHEQAYMPGQILVKFNEGVPRDKALDIHTRLESIVVRHFEKIAVDLVQIKVGVSVEEAINLYQEDPHVDYAEPNYMRRMQTKMKSANP